MTEPPRGRDDSPTLAVLAVRVNELRQQIETLIAKVDALNSTQEEHASVLADIAELRDQVERVLTAVADDDEDSQTSWFWLTMTDQERDERFSELSDWVETVFRPQYPDYLTDQIRPCWPNHPEARWELAWVYQLWSRAYLIKQPSPKDAADWHDRWCPGVVRRLATVMNRCETACQRQPGRKTIGDSLHRLPY